MMALHILASGSKGNSSIIENLDTGEGIVIDCGICKRDFNSRSHEAGFDVRKIKAVFITHDHSDHVRNLGVILRSLRGLDFCLYGLDEVLCACGAQSQSENLCDLQRLELGQAVDVAGLKVTPFETSHDAAASCGFRVDSQDGDALGFMTDTGCVTDAAFEALGDVRILALEANHDVNMLDNGQYPYFLKKRVSSDRGHLSNKQAASALKRVYHNGLEHVVAMHISQNNNLPVIVEETIQSVLDDMSSNAKLHLSSQTRLTSIKE